MHKTVKMFGPSISDPSKIVNRDVPECDIAAYELAGYQKGSINEVPEPAAEVVETAAPAVQAKPKGRTKK